jgi:hypothetical protein
MYVLLIVVCPKCTFSFGHLLSVLLRYTDSDCPFVIFSHIMARTSYISMMWWWCPLCTLDQQKTHGIRSSLFVSSFIGSFYSIFSFICMFCWSLFVLNVLFLLAICCLFFFDIRILIAPLVSSSSFYTTVKLYYLFIDK